MTVKWTVVVAAAALALLPASVRAQPAGDAERARLAHEVVKAVGGAANMTAAARAAMNAVALPQVGTPEGQKAIAEIRAYLSERMAVYAPEMLAGVEAVYAREFTADQLRDILAFYRSPTGREMSRKLPEISHESVLALQPVITRMQRDLLGKVCELTACTAQQKSQLDALKGVSS